MSFITDWLGISAYARNKKILGEYTREQHKMCMRVLKKCNLPQVSLMRMMEDNQVNVIHEVTEELEYKHGPLVYSDSLKTSSVLNSTQQEAKTHCNILSNILGRNLAVVEVYNCAKDEAGLPFVSYGMGISDKQENKILKTLSLKIS